MIKFGDKDRTPMRCLKVMKGSSLVWEKMTIKTISYESEETIRDLDRDIYVPEDIYSTLNGKDLIELAIGSYKVKKGDFHLNKHAPIFSLSKSMMDVAGLLDWIPAGTKITITYK